MKTIYSKKSKVRISQVAKIRLGDEIHRIAWADAVKVNDASPEKDLVGSVSMLAEASILAAEAEYEYDRAYNDRKEVYAAIFADGKEDGMTDRAAEAEAKADPEHKIALEGELSAKRAMLIAQAVKASLLTKVNALRTILYRE